MRDTKTKIAAGLERAFAARGFAEPSVEDLRDAAGVSLRTLYKYTPSRSDMVVVALEYRNDRYLERVFSGLPVDPEAALDVVFERVAGWMEEEASHGCLFHAAVGAAPQDPALQELLRRHKTEMAARTAQATGLAGREADLTLLIEGLMQSWPLLRAEAVESAKRLGRMVIRGK
ncbi:TetR/AcrR family transcriptional regulator [Amaricoccus macauensis]|uniref:TetR/AcrR family transcriptional regulator n=1 Tax=Amaricoccus macauensis TaxID=57001 RepID=UPI003C7E4D7F